MPLSAYIWERALRCRFLKTITTCLVQVYAPTIPGFGRSEKPALAYSQTLWLDFLRDFVVEVVRRPVVVVGNSIGGYISASLAAASPGIVKGARKDVLAASLCTGLYFFFLA